MWGTEFFYVILSLALKGPWWSMCFFGKWNFGIEIMLLWKSVHLCKRAQGASTQSVSMGPLLENTFFLGSSPVVSLCYAIGISSVVQLSIIFKDEGKHVLPSRHMRTFSCATQEPQVDVWFGHWLVAMVTLHFDSWSKCNIRHHRI